jgi:hypothetical protein
MYAGTVNIMLNGLGVVLSPAGNPGFLPGMNAGAYNLGDAKASYLTVVVTGLVITVAAFGASLLIPKPVEAEVAE